MPLEEVDTPALIVELDPLERNIRRMATHFADRGLRLRPHAKTHKCAVIARRQMAVGAVGVCCQKVSEAEALVHAGVPDVLVSNEVVGARKIERLATLAREARVGVCVDDAENVTALSTAATRQGVEIEVLVEIDVGASRCGVQPGRPALALARRVAELPGLRFGGLQAYQGRAQHLRGYIERRDAIAKAIADARYTVDLLEENGIECRTVAGAGTGTFEFELESGVYNELQPGSYVFMDADYARNRKQDGDWFDDFEHSLFVYATVMSRPDPGKVIVDAGLKALATDSGMPTVADVEGANYHRVSDEHGIIDLSEAERSVDLGEKLRLVPGHCDPTVNLYDWLVVIRNGAVDALWPVVARGALT